MSKQSWYIQFGLISLMMSGLILMSGCSVGLGFGIGPVGLYFSVYADPDVTSPEAKRFISRLYHTLKTQRYQLTVLENEHTIGFTARRELDLSEITPSNNLPHVPGRVSTQIVSEGEQVHLNSLFDLKTLETADAHADSSIHCNLKMNFLQPPMNSNADQIENQGKTLEWSFQAVNEKLVEVGFAS